jgi:outer membrane protein
MKHLFVATLLILATSATAFSQRFAYVNTDYILSNIPDFNDAQKKIDDLAAGWKDDGSKKQKEIDDLYKAYQNEQYLLTEDQKKAKVKEIEDKEKALKDFQNSKFGYQGDLFKKRQELIKPIQDKVYAEIEKMAKDRGYDFIFDKANSTTVLYADIKNDKSDDILKALGYTPQQKSSTNK